MRTARDVIDRVRFDPSLPQESFALCYLDRFRGAVEKPLASFNFSDIPLHRILAVLYKGQSGVRPVWDKREPGRRDQVFGSYPEDQATTIADIIATDPPGGAICEADLADGGQDEEEEQAQRFADNAIRPNYFVCCRILSRRAAIRAAAIQASDPVLARGALPASRMHITLVTLRLRNEGEVQRAADAIREFELAAAIHGEEPITLSGVGSFSSRVLYAKPTQGRGLLVDLHERIRNHLVERLGLRCWVGQSRQVFTPHVTLAKISRSMARDGLELPEDAVWNNASADFGVFKVRAIHLCPMQAPKAGHGDGFYPVLASAVNSSALLMDQHVLRAVCSRLRLTQTLSSGAEPSNQSVVVMEQLAAQASARLARTPADPAAPTTEKAFVLRRVRTESAGEGLDRSGMTRQINMRYECDSAGAPLALAKSELALRASQAVLDAARLVVQLGPGDVILSGAFACKAWYVHLLRLARAFGFSVVVEEQEQMALAQDWRSVDLQWEADPLARVIEPASSPHSAEDLARREKGEHSADGTLFVFDIDGTLLCTPDAPARWARPVWVSLPLSLEDNAAFDRFVKPGPALEAFKSTLSTRGKHDAIAVVSGRKSSLRSQLHSLLGRFGISADAMFLKSSDCFESTSQFKGRIVSEMVRAGGFSKVEFYDDDVRARNAVEDAIDASDEGALTVTVVDPSCLIGRIGPAESLSDIAFRWVLANFGVVLRERGLESPGEGSVLRFGSRALGRRSSDYDICLVSPTSRVFEPLFLCLTRDSPQSGLPSGVRLVDSHFAGQARCPRISLQLEMCASLDACAQESLELDIILAVVNAPTTCSAIPVVVEAEGATAAQASNLGLEHALALQSHVACRDTPSVRALAGPIATARALLVLRETATEVGDFAELVDKSLAWLARSGLSGAHFQCVRTFQISRLATMYIQAGNSATSLSGFARFVGTELAEQQLHAVLAGELSENSADFAVCHPVYWKRIRAAFQSLVAESLLETAGEPVSPTSGPERCGVESTLDFDSNRADLLRFVVQISGSTRWQLKLALEAGFPAVVRAVVAQLAQHAASWQPAARGPISARGEASVCVEFSCASTTASGARIEPFVAAAVSQLRLPEGATLRLQCGLPSGPLCAVAM